MNEANPTKLYPKILENGKTYFSFIDIEKLSETKKRFLEGWRKVKKKEFEEGFSDEKQLMVLKWLASDERVVLLPYPKFSDKVLKHDEYYQKLNWKNSLFDFLCENPIFSYEEFLASDYRTIQQVMCLDIEMGSSSDDENDYWCEEYRLRDVVLDYIRSDLQGFIKQIGWDLSDLSEFAHIGNGEVVKFYDKSNENGSDYHQYFVLASESKAKWIEEHFAIFFEGHCPAKDWTKDMLWDSFKKKETQSTLFSAVSSEKVSPQEEESTDDEDLAEVDEELVEEDEEEEEVAEPKAQATLFGSVATKPATKLKILEDELYILNSQYWIKREFDVIAEVDSGKIFDANEQDGLFRDFEIGSCDFEALGMTEEDYEKLSYEQYVKKCMEKQLEFNENELGLDVEAINKMSYEELEKQIQDKEAEIKAEKEKKQAKKEPIMVVKQVQQRLII